MSDVGLSAQLELDTRRALAEIDALEARLLAASQVTITAEARGVTTAVDAAIEAADTDVTVEAEAGAVTTAVDSAIESADTGVKVEADAADVTGSIDAAVQAADDAVEITATASGVTGAVDAAVAAADTDVTVTLDVEDGGSVQAAQVDVKRLDEATDRAAKSGDRLKQALAAVTVGATAKAIYDVVTAASDLAESASKAETVFGDSFGAIEGFAEDAATSVGLSEQAALEATGTFGNLFQALGLSREAASDLSPEVVTLAADLASFNNLELDETLEKLRSGLVGEVEPLRSLGVSFNAAQVEAKAFEMGLGDANGELTEGEKVQARYALVVEQTSLAHGDFARTSEGLANQQRILTAEFDNAKAAAGQALLPTFLDLVAAGRDLIPTIQELAERVFPPLLDIVETLLPVFGSTLDILIALAPVLEVIASVVGAIPAPVLLAVGAMLSFNSAAGLAGGLADKATKGISSFLFTAGPAAKAAEEVAEGATAVEGAAAKSGRTLSLLGPAAVLAGIGLAGYSRIQQEAAELEAERTKTIQAINAELDNGTSVLKAYASAFDQAAADNEEFRSALNDLGVTTGELSTALLGGRDAYLELAIEQGRAEGLSFGQVEQLLNQASAADEAARATLESAAATDAESAAIVTVNVLRNTAKDGTVNYTAALQGANAELQRVKEETEALAQAQADAIAEGDAIAQQYLSTADALVRVGEESPAVAGAIKGLRGNAGDTETGFLDLALALDGATLSEEAMGDVAALVGTDVETLTGFVDGLTDALNDFVDDATSKLPTVSDAFDAALKANQDAAKAQADSIRESGRLLGRERVGAVEDQSEAEIEALQAAAATRIEELRHQQDDNIALFQQLSQSDAVEETGIGSLAEAQRLQEEANRAAEAIEAQTAEQVELLRERGSATSTAAADSATEAAEAEAQAIEDGATITAGAFIGALTAQTAALAKYRGDLKRISDAGFADVAATIAREGPEIGGALASELAQALDEGNVGIVEEVQTATDLFEQEWSDTTAYFRDNLGPQFILTSGLIGSGAAAAFGEDLDFETRVRIAAGLAETGLDETGQAIAAVAAAEGADAARAYGEALGLDTETINAAIAAGNAILDNDQSSDFSLAGTRWGQAVGDGVAAGIRSTIGEVNDTINDLLVLANQDVKKNWGIFSPSRRMAVEIGEPLGEGIAVGLDDSAKAVLAATQRIIDDAAALTVPDPTATAFTAWTLPVAQVAPSVLSESASGGSLSVALHVGQIVFEAGTDREVVRNAGADLADGFAEQLVDMNITFDAALGGPRSSS